MTIHQISLLEEIECYVQSKLRLVDAGHDYSHIKRVLHHALLINKAEKANDFLVRAGVLLHDITDEKLFNKKEAEKVLICFLAEKGLINTEISSLIDIVNAVSFGGEFDQTQELTQEQKVVRDADRLDAMGAIGIARTFHYGGSKNRELFNADIPPQQYNSTQAYRNSSSPTINHFYEKLLLLKERMETQTGKRLAEERHLFMKTFLTQFYNEIGVDGFQKI